MSQTRPSYEDRDKYLDVLATAYAQGRLSDSQFAERSDQVLTGETRDVLEQAMAGIKTEPRPYQPMADTGYQPQPYQAPSPPSPLYSRPTTHTTRRGFLVGGAAAVGVLAVGVIMFGSSRGPSVAGGPYTEPTTNPFPPEIMSDSLRTQAQELLRQGVFGEVLITRDSVTAVTQQPGAENWQRIKITGIDRELAPATPVKNTFEAADFDLDDALGLVFETQSRALTEAQLKEIKIYRPGAQPQVHVNVLLEDGTRGVWVAFSHELVEFKKGG